MEMVGLFMVKLKQESLLSKNNLIEIASLVLFVPQMEDYYLPQVSEIVEAARKLAAY